jgi:mono/diheme cytochrome c family protein
MGVVLAVLAFLPASVFGYRAWQSVSTGIRTVEIVARAPQEGGFSPDRLTLRAGETVRLRLSSPDVVHGFSIPGLNVNVDEIYPGKLTEIDLTPLVAGRYAFACTRWCGVDHWRMRGVIEVIGDPPPPMETVAQPLFQQLGIDLDALRPPASSVPRAAPSVEAGAALGLALPEGLDDVSARQSQAPADAFQALRADPANAALSDDDVWNLVAWAWLKDVEPVPLTRAEALYARDCAACHGLDGKGTGPAGAKLAGMQKMNPAMPKGPADFTDAVRMLAASDALLQGKLLRGGMGTGMPEFGSLYSDEEQWAMVAYLRMFLFRR